MFTLHFDPQHSIHSVPFLVDVHLRVLDCSVVSDGCASVKVAEAENCSTHETDSKENQYSEACDFLIP